MTGVLKVADVLAVKGSRVVTVERKGPQGREPGALLQPYVIEGTSVRVKR